MSHDPGEGAAPPDLSDPNPPRHAIDRISAAASAVSAVALLAMAVAVGIEVASRYLFNAPTIWVWDANVQLMMLMVMLGMAEVLRRDLNVRVDLLTAALPPRGQAALDLVCLPMLLFVFGVIAWTGWEYAHQAFERGQRASTIWAPLLWPIKFATPLGAALVLLQALAKGWRDVRRLRHGEAAAS